jgi:menaquinol-cytochrome c reductase cytochrome b/c subunit
MAEHHDKDVEYVGDSRVERTKTPNIPKDYSDYPGKTEMFLPNFLLKEWMVAAVVLVGFLVLTIVHPSPLEAKADPTNSAYIPLPDWYFLFLYQLLKFKYTSGDWVVLGTVVVPGLAFGALTLAPWLDRGPERRFYKRPIASSLMMLSLAAIVYLTWASVDEHQANHPGDGPTGELPAIVEPDSEGYMVYQKSSCIGCHATDLTGQAGFAPPLLGTGDKFSREELVDIMKNGIGNMPAGMWDASIAQGLTEEDMNKLADWLAIQKSPAGDEKGKH